MPVVGAAQILVRPSFAGFQTSARREALGAGRSASVAFAGAFAAGAALKKIGTSLFGGDQKSGLAAAQRNLAEESAKAAKAVQVASRKQADAVRSVQIAEQKLREYRAKDFQTLSGLQAAEKRLASARDDLTDATQDSEKATIAQSKALDKGQKSLTEAERAAGRGARTMKALGGAAKVAGVAAAAGFAALTVGAARGLSSTIAPARDFDKQIRLAGTTLGATGEQMTQLSDLAIDMGSKTSFSAKGAADALVELAKGGMDPATIAGGALQETLTLATAGGLELGSAATFMVNGLNAFQLEAKDAGSVAAALAGGANASTASVESLGLGLSQTSAQAHTAGLSLQDTVAALAALDNAGIKGSDSGTSLKVMLQRLVPSTKNAQQAFEDLGLITLDAAKMQEFLLKQGIKPSGDGIASLTNDMQKYAMNLADADSYTVRAQKKFTELGHEIGFANNQFFDAQGNIKSMAEVSGVLSEALEGQTREQKISTLNTLFGSDASRAAGIIAQTGAKQIGEYAAAASDQTQAQLLAKSATEGFAGAQERLQGGLETVQIQIGTYLLPILSRSADFISGRVLPVVSRLVEEFGPKLGPAIDRARGAVQKFFDFVQRGYGAVAAFAGSIRDATDSFRDAGGGFIEKYGTDLQIVGGAIAGITAALFGYRAVAGVLDFTRAAATAATTNVQLGIMAVRTWAVTTAQAAYTAVVNGARIATALMTAGQWALNAAWLANPVGIVIAALIALGTAVVLAYRHSETFRNIVQGAWVGIKVAVDATWQFLSQTVWPGIRSVLTLIGTAAVGLWQNYIKPAWAAVSAGAKVVGGVISAAFSAIGAAATWLWQKAIKPVVDVIVGALTTVGSAVSYLWRSYISPIFQLIGAIAVWLAQKIFKVQVAAIVGLWRSLGTVVQWTYDRVIKPTFAFFGRAVTTLKSAAVATWRAMQTAWALLGSLVKLAYDRVVKPTFEAFARLGKWLWTNVLKPTWALMKAGWQALTSALQAAWTRYVKPSLEALGRLAQSVWRNVVKPAWDAMKSAWATLASGVKSVYDKTLKPVLGFLGDRVTELKGVFSRAVEAIGRAWDGLKAAARKPVKFVIDVINGLIGGEDGKSGGFNSLAKKFGTDTMPKVPYPSGLGFDRGGIEPGFSSYRQGDTLVRGFRPGEGVIVSEALRDPYERARLLALNKAALRGESAAQFRARYHEDARMEGFARGGFMGGARPHPGPWSSHGSNYYGARAAGDFGSGYGGTPAVQAWKSGTVAQVMSGNTSYGNRIRINHGKEQTLYAHLSRFLVAVGDKVREGQTIARAGWSGNVRPRGPGGAHTHWELRGGSGALGAIGDGIRNLADAAKDKIVDWAGDMKDKLAGPLGKLREITGTAMGRLAAAVPSKVAGMMKDKAAGWATKAKEAIVGVGDGGSAVGSGRGAAREAGLKLGASSVGTYPGHQPSMNKAWDFMATGKTGQTIANHLAKNRKEYGISYLIWNREILRDYRKGLIGAGRWGPYFDGWSTNPNRAHTNHVHASFYEKGTMNAAPGWAVVGESRPELVNFRGGEQVASNRQQLDQIFGGGRSGPQEIRGTLDMGNGLKGYVAGIVSDVTDARDLSAAHSVNLPIGV